MMKKLSLRTFGIITLLFQLLLFRFLCSRTQWIETVFVPKVFYPLSSVFRWVTSWFPFSVGLVFIYFLCGLLIVLLIRNVRKVINGSLPFKDALLSLAAWGSLVFLFYAVTWGLLYYRQPVSVLLRYDTAPATVEELRSLCEDLVNRTNHARSRLTDSAIYKISPESLVEKAPKAYSATRLPFLKYATPSIKMATGSSLLAYMGTSGIYTFWSGEANINRVNTNVDLPAVTLHEMAHQVGFASEDEANYIAWRVGKDYPDPLFQYSSAYNVVWRSLRRLWNVDSTYAQTLYSRLDSAVYRDAKIENARWDPYRNPGQKYVISPFYNLFLKANGREYGIMSYDRVVDLIIYERRGSDSVFVGKMN
ncbi:MAG: DUF3810 domain-containing protein [Leadbetterella sp.]|nr:DUF3810 domain-containing protein [Leadbetterella sp.]